MRNIPIDPVPNQELSVNIDGNRWVIRLKVARVSMCADIILNDEPLMLGQRIAVGTPIIPYEYLALQGNFLLLVDDELLPDWRLFGSTQQLVYVAPGEYLYSVPYEFGSVPAFSPKPLLAPYNLFVDYVE